MVLFAASMTLTEYLRTADDAELEWIINAPPAELEVFLRLFDHDLALVERRRAPSTPPAHFPL